ncbi:hypothetical protein M885DRAFT_505588 [Pelagophyceae sp. CCMP2097]|nr:hypothetical protein M885DRAFT_505588 [Pelagophyceae sp. CCMP2097]
MLSIPAASRGVPAVLPETTSAYERMRSQSLQLADERGNPFLREKQLDDVRFQSALNRNPRACEPTSADVARSMRFSAPKLEGDKRNSPQDLQAMLLRDLGHNLLNDQDRLQTARVDAAVARALRDGAGGASTSASLKAARDGFLDSADVPAFAPYRDQVETAAFIRQGGTGQKPLRQRLLHAGAAVDLGSDRIEARRKRRAAAALAFTRSGVASHPPYKPARVGMRPAALRLLLASPSNDAAAPPSNDWETARGDFASTSSTLLGASRGSTLSSLRTHLERESDETYATRADVGPASPRRSRVSADLPWAEGGRYSATTAPSRLYAYTADARADGWDASFGALATRSDAEYRCRIAARPLLDVAAAADSAAAARDRLKSERDEFATGAGAWGSGPKRTSALLTPRSLEVARLVRAQIDRYGGREARRESDASERQRDEMHAAIAFSARGLEPLSRRASQSILFGDGLERPATASTANGDDDGRGDYEASRAPVPAPQARLAPEATAALLRSAVVRPTLNAPTPSLPQRR